MLTAKGLTWVVVALTLILLGLGFTATPVLLVGVGMVLHVALAWTLLGHPRLEGRIELAQREVTEKESLRVALAIVNRGRRPTIVRYRLRLPESFRDAQDRSVGLLVIGPGASASVAFDVVPLLHGPYDVGPLELLIQDPAALVTREVQVAPDTSLLTYPRIEEVRDRPLTARMVTPYIGLHEVQQPGDGFEFYALRNYQSGDPMRSINWRASARSRGLIVNQRVKESYAAVTVLVDGRAWEGLGIQEHAPWFRSARAAAALADSFSKGRDRVTFHLVTDDAHTIAPQPPDRQRRHILDLLAATRPAGHASLAERIERMLPDLRPRSLFVLLTSLENEPGLPAALRQLGVRDIQVLIVSAGSQWPTNADPSLTRGIEERRAAAVQAARATGARVVDWAPDQLLSVTLQEVLYA